MKLKIGTYNICHCADFSNQRPNEDDQISRNTVCIENTAKIIKSLNCDIIGLNEVYNNGNMGREDFLNQTEKLAKLTNYPYSYYAQGFDYVWTDIGNTILSKYPIKNLSTFTIPTVPEEERTEDTWYEQRVLIVTDIDVENTIIKVIVTHFGLAQIELERIVNKVCEIIDNSQYPTFLMGDFNVTPNHPILRKLYDRLKSCAKETNNNEFTFATYNPQIQIDYIFAPKNLKITSYNVEKVNTSDHYPIFAEIDI